MRQKGAATFFFPKTLLQLPSIKRPDYLANENVSRITRKPYASVSAANTIDITGNSKRVQDFRHVMARYT